MLRSYLAKKSGSLVAFGKKTGFNVPVEEMMRGPLYPLFLEAVTQRTFAADGPLNVPNIRDLSVSMFDGVSRS